MKKKRAFRIFISSPDDVSAERKSAREIIEKVSNRLEGPVTLELSPFFWEEHPQAATGEDFQAQIPGPALFDLVVCILWSKLGSPPKEKLHRRQDKTPYESGTQLEFEESIAAFGRHGKPVVLVYRRTDRPKLDIDAEEQPARRRDWDQLQRFVHHWFEDRSSGAPNLPLRYYSGPAEFEKLFWEHLRNLPQLAQAQAASEGRTVDPHAGPRLTAWPRNKSPYRGLEVFDLDHEPIFFGRTRARDAVTKSLRKRAKEEACPCILIYGASGSGKSSLLRAGVLPQLLRPGPAWDDGPDVDQWRWAVFRPTDTPLGGDLLDGLARALLSQGAENQLGQRALPELADIGWDEAALADQLRHRPQSLGSFLRPALEKAGAPPLAAVPGTREKLVRLALGLDQLEEIFTAQVRETGSTESRERFNAESRVRFFHAVDALARSGLVWVAATLRSEFYPRCDEHPELVELSRGEGEYRLLPPTEEEVRDMILRPAETVGLEFEVFSSEEARQWKLGDAEPRRLEERLCADARSSPEGLPLLEFALNQLFLRCPSGLLTHRAYEEMERLTGVVAQQAEAIFNARLRDATETEAALTGILWQLVRLSEKENEPAARQPAPYETLIRGPADAPFPAAKALVDVFVENRLLVKDLDPERHPFVSLAHESLLRVWPRAAEWVKRNNGALRLRERVSNARKRWEASGDKVNTLLAGLDLAEAEKLLPRQMGEDGLAVLDATNQKFIQASLAHRAARQKRERRAFLAVAAMILALAAIALWRGQVAREQESLAVANARAAREQEAKAKARSLEAEQRRTEAENQTTRANTATEEAARNLEEARRLLKVAARNDVEEARSNFRQGAQARAFALLARAFRYDPAVPGGSEAAIHWLHVSGLRPPRAHLLGHTAPIKKAEFSKDGRRFLTVSEDRTARLWNPQTGESVGRPLSHIRSPDLASVCANGSLVFTVVDERTVQVWSTEDGEPFGEPMGGKAPLRQAAISADGSRALTLHEDARAYLWDPKSGKIVSDLAGGEHDLVWAYLLKDGRRV